MFYLVLLLSVSYWYHLPVLTQAIFDYSEFRGYDILLVLLTGLLVHGYRQPLLRFFQQDVPGKWLFRFCLWATATTPLTILTSYYLENPLWSAVTLVYLFHLWGYLLAYGAFRLFVRTPGQCRALLDLFLIAGIAEAILICLQGIEIVPLLWGERYEAYGARAFSGTLGPNRQLPGYMMLLVFAVSAAYWRNWRSLGIPRLGLAAAGGLGSILGVALSSSRTAWVAFLAYFAISIVGRRQFGFAAFSAAIILAAVFLAPVSLSERILEVYNARIAGPITDTMSGVGMSDNDEMARLEAIDAGRMDIWGKGVDTIVHERPWLIPFGGGFNNYSQAVARGMSGHNLYLTLTAEVGILGLGLYLAWLVSIIRESAVLTSRAAEAARLGARTFVPVELSSLVMAVMVGLFAGEILYPYRPSFTFLGVFLFLCAIMHHPALIYGTVVPGAAHDLGTEFEKRRARRLPAMRMPRMAPSPRGVPRPAARAALRS